LLSLPSSRVQARTELAAERWPCAGPALDLEEAPPDIMLSALLLLAGLRVAGREAPPPPPASAALPPAMSSLNIVHLKQVEGWVSEQVEERESTSK